MAARATALTGETEIADDVSLSLSVVSCSMVLQSSSSTVALQCFFLVCFQDRKESSLLLVCSFFTYNIILLRQYTVERRWYFRVKSEGHLNVCRGMIARTPSSRSLRRWCGNGEEADVISCERIPPRGARVFFALHAEASGRQVGNEKSSSSLR